jgi:hypothetical protein
VDGEEDEAEEEEAEAKEAAKEGPQDGVARADGDVQQEGPGDDHGMMMDEVDGGLSGGWASCLSISLTYPSTTVFLVPSFFWQNKRPRFCLLFMWI